MSDPLHPERCPACGSVDVTGGRCPWCKTHAGARKDDNDAEMLWYLQTRRPCYGNPQNNEDPICPGRRHQVRAR